MNRARTLLMGCSSLTLAASLGAAAPATQPAAPQLRAGEPQVLLRLLKRPVELQASGIIHTPRNDTNITPTIRPPYLTPRRDWIPRTLNGKAFYLIPCVSNSALAATTAADTLKVSIGTLAPTTRPVSIPPASREE